MGSVSGQTTRGTTEMFKQRFGCVNVSDGLLALNAFFFLRERFFRPTRERRASDGLRTRKEDGEGERKSVREGENGGGKVEEESRKPERKRECERERKEAAFTG